MPETSIIIRTYNEEKHIGNLLGALQRQTYRDYEIIIVDSGSTDRTLEITEKYPVQIIRIENCDFTFGYALNVGCQAALGKYLVFVSAHILPATETWLAHLVASFENSAIGMAYGRQKGGVGSKYSEQKDFWRLFSKKAVNSKVPLHYANNANSAIRKNLWEKERFDEYLFGLEDIDWARKITSKGFLIHYEPNAPVYHLHNETWPQVFNRYRREAIAAVRIGLPHPPQARFDVGWLLVRIFADIFGSSQLSLSRIKEILRFRYYQWKGSRVGWAQGAHLDLKRDKNSVFKPIENKAVLIKGPLHANYVDLLLPEMKPSDILIQVEYVGVCRTDIEVYEGTLGYYRDGIAHYPIVPGHEFSGTIIRVGSNNRYQERFKVGERVVGECILSRDPSDRKEVGVINYNGAYSTYILISGRAVHQIPADVDLKKASLAEPLAVALRAIRRVQHRLSAQSKIAVIGAGAIGYLCAEVLIQEGYEVTVFDKNPERIAYVKEKAYEVSRSLERLEQFDVLFEVTGSKEVLEQVIKQSRSDSTIMLLGFPYGDIQYNFEDLVGQEKFLAGSVGGDAEDFEKALKLLPKIEMLPHMSAVLPLADFKQAWELHRSATYLKIFLKP